MGVAPTNWKNEKIIIISQEVCTLSKLTTHSLARQFESIIVKGRKDRS